MNNTETVTPPSPNPSQPEGFLNAQELLIAVWPNENSRPCLRWLKKYAQELGVIPYIKMGSVWYDPIEVREAIKTKFTIGGKKR